MHDRPARQPFCVSFTRIANCKRKRHISSIWNALNIWRCSTIHQKISFQYFRSPPKGERATVFIDEIQYLDNPSNFLKLLFDEYRNRLKLVVTGSSAFYIDEKFKDSLAGRKRLFHLPTLSFSEFLVFKQRDDLANLLPTRLSPDNFNTMSLLPLMQRDELVRLFSEFSRFGGVSCGSTYSG